MLSIDEKIVLVECAKRNPGNELRAARMALPNRSPSGLRLHLIACKLRTARGWWTLRDQELLVRLWNAGKTCPEVATALGKPERGVRCYITENRQRLGLVRHNDPWFTSAQKVIIGREVERLMDFIEMRFGHKRSARAQVIMEYLMAENRRKRAASIADLGGMAANSPPGTKKRAA